MNRSHGLARTPRIVGGAAVTPFEHNWVSLLHVYQPGGATYSMCGASLLQDGWALTAAHCTEGAAASRMTIGVHRHARRWDDDEHECTETIAISEVLEHKDYETVSLTNDIALLRLSRSPTYSCLKFSPCPPQLRSPP